MVSAMRELTAQTKYKNYNIIIGDSVLSEIERVSRLLSRDRFAVIISSNVFGLYENLIKSMFAGFSNYEVEGWRRE